MEVLAEIKTAREKLKIAGMIQTLYESKQQRSEIKQVSSRPITNRRPIISYLAQNDDERQINILDIYQLHHID